MKQTVNIATIFPKHLFWDMDYSKLNPAKDKDIIIPRAMYATTPATFEKDIQKLEAFIQKKILLNILKALKNVLLIRYVKW